MTLTSFKVRRATIEDVPRLHALAAQSKNAPQWNEFDYRRFFENISLVPEASHVPVAAEAISQEAVMLVAEEGGSVHAFVAARRVDREWEIENIVVKDSMQRRGLAGRLIAELVSLACASGDQTIYLEVRDSNYAARALYAKCGFAESGRRKGYYHLPDEDAILYKFTFSTADRSSLKKG